MMDTTRLVLCPPSTASQAKRPKKSSTRHATEAGNETDSRLNSTSTPKHAASMGMMPAGIKNQLRRKCLPDAEVMA